MENSHAWLGATTSASIAGKSGKLHFHLIPYFYFINKVVFAGSLSNTINVKENL